MQVEEKPDVTYSDVGGCKEQIEKLREVVETPLLHVSFVALSCLTWQIYNHCFYWHYWNEEKACNKFIVSVIILTHKKTQNI